MILWQYDHWEYLSTERESLNQSFDLATGMWILEAKDEEELMDLLAVPVIVH